MCFLCPQLFIAAFLVKPLRPCWTFSSFTSWVTVICLLQLHALLISPLSHSCTTLLLPPYESQEFGNSVVQLEASTLSHSNSTISCWQRREEKKRKWQERKRDQTNRVEITPNVLEKCIIISKGLFTYCVINLISRFHFNIDKSHIKRKTGWLRRSKAKDS